ncbi:hypothetical protein [Ramlibacter sp.]|uniref:hypothetical protein n=1 Tax=Ramlibacter sp. TaxID=1917967 RepID=UPI0026080C88|nr:hypothetical protein [Ramlibacter sp.]MDB5958169.1 hypothetical protein [Ramlibacter sp.]
MRMLQLATVCAALAACAGVPVGSGGRDEIVFAAADTIRIRWNPKVTNAARVRAEAIAYCGGRPVDEVAASLASEASGLLSSTWQCRPSSGAGM